MRPSALARQVNMSRQATNYMIVQLEEMGYLTRRAGPDGGRRLVYLTERGRRLGETIFAALRRLQLEWADRVGHRRFAAFIAVLRELAPEPDVESGIRSN
ncbi:MAG: winged helix DNA-binding protein [Proteobacteria bacterium]|nr:winged helix DNA-binding protein [Pseudomonadota bacterium]